MVIHLIRRLVESRVFAVGITLMLLGSALPSLADLTQAQGTTTVAIQAFDADGVTPLPFARFQIVDSTGFDYGKRETGLDGTSVFSVEANGDGRTYTVSMETPPACGIAPEPQVIGPFVGGETESLAFVTTFDPNCNLGTLAVYRYTCPETIDAASTTYEDWVAACPDEVNGVAFRFQSVTTQQQWNPVTGEYGIAGRAPIVGLPPGQYTIQQVDSLEGKIARFFCLTYDTPNFTTSPQPSEISLLDTPNNLALVTLNGNRVSCDMFVAPATAETVAPEPTATTDGAGETAGPTAAPTGTATTTSELNLRSDPEDNAEVLVVMPVGSTVEVLGSDTNGYTPVRFEGQDGWAGTAFLEFGNGGETPVEPAEPTTTATSETEPTREPIGSGVTNSDVNLRDAPTIDSNVLGVLQPGSAVEILGASENGFLPIRYQDQEGWVSDQFVTIDGAEPTVAPPTETPVSPTATATTEPTVSATTAPIGTAVTNSSVNMRAEASLDSAIVQVVPGNAEVEVLGLEENGFLPARYDGLDGWISSAFLSVGGENPTETPTVVPPTVTATTVPTLAPTTVPIGTAVTTSSVNMRAESSLDSAIVQVVPGNAEVEILGPQQNDFLPTRYQGLDGWISVAFLSQGGATSTTTPEVLPQDLSATLELHKLVCEPGYEPGPGIFDDCHDLGAANVTFFLEGPNGFATSGVTTIPSSPGPGVVVFDGLEAGSYTINEDVPGDFTSIFVYCSMADSDQVVEFTYNDAIQGIDLALGGGESVICDWYNIPDVQQQDPASIELHKAVCEPGYVPGPNIFDDCHSDGLGDVTFTIEGPNGFSDSAVTTVPVSPGPGVVEFQGLEAGSYTINEDVPGDFTSISVYCSLAGADQTVPFTYNDAIQGIDIDLAAGQNVICDWYNIPDQQFSGSIEVVKRTCPVGYDASDAGFDEFWRDCRSLTNDVEFLLTPDGGVGAVRTTGDDGAGTAIFYGLGGGDFTLSEDLPGEFVQRYAYCGPDSGNLSATTVTDGAVSLSLSGDQAEVLCLWYNVPEDLSGETGSISLTNYLCPPGTSANFFANCSATPVAGSTFVLDGPGEVAGQLVAGASGAVSFTDLPAGNYSIQGIPPAGTEVAIYVVTCQAGGAAYTFAYDDSTGMRIRLNLPPGGDVFCNWYNVPPKKVVLPPPGTGGQGSVTVHKFLCTGKQVSEFDWSKDCLVETRGAGFTLKNGAGTLVSSGTTNTSGLLVFTGIANGAYSLDETTSNWCHAEADKVDASGRVIVSNNANTDVFIYNCGSRNVGSLPNTGIGLTNQGSDPWLLLFALATLGLAGGGYALRKRPAA